MPSAYLQTGDLATFGVPSAAAAQITQASAMIDAFLQRPEGLLWEADSQGMPCDMASLQPTVSFALTGAIAAGLNVQAPLSGPVAALQPGDAVVLDRSTANVREVCTVIAITGNVATFASVINAHASGGTVDLGLLIEEQKYMPDSRPVTFVSRTPLVNIVSGVGRYAYGRRSDALNYNMEQFNLLAAVSKFGGPPAWEIFNPINTGFDAGTGQVWIPAGIMLAYYSEVKLRYVAGYSAANCPGAVKQACANIIQAIVSSPLNGNTKSMKAGDTAIERFADTMLDADTKAMLDPFRARAFI